MTQRRRLLLVWLISVIGLTALVALQLVPNRHRMEDDLTSRSSRALAAAGAQSVEVSFTGRDGVLHVADEATATRARTIVAALDGVRTVRTLVDPVVEAPAPPPRLLPSLLATVADGRVALTGTVPGDAHRAALHSAAASRFATVDDRVTIGDVTDEDLPAVAALLGALPRTAADLQVRMESDVLTLSGTAASELEWAALTTAAHRTGLTVVDALSVADLDAQLADVPPLMFQSDSSRLSPQARRNLWRAAGLLHANPSASFRVEGYTDSLEAGGEALGAERAAAVRDVLAEFGIDQDRMTIEGYAPGAPNGTDAERARQRHAELVVTGRSGP
ncbi:OmpA family protein [Catenuloplanes sp. NPDC051500]|uniref:OmpA family protein n=1 Tax=Catenuloplanes sp. NPDC051500 TaxID=3363959 RepID=UPI0037AF6E73